MHHNHRTKIESSRSKKNSPHTSATNHTQNTINTYKGTINIREARTKPTSPERSYMLINSFKKGVNAVGAASSFVTAGHAVNQREERKALNMISNINSSHNPQ